MTTAACAPAIDRQGAFGVTGRRSAAAETRLTAPVINMGLVEIQKQAKAS